jgi:nucleoside 2-deoxyribosyltransferase
MPFSEEMLDVFLLGIRSVAAELNFVANRADDLEHNGEIIDEIKDAIKTADFVIADTTGSNANVCYEVGFAHALEKPTVLLCRKGEKLPFDLKGTNHIMYPNVVGIRTMLKAKLENMLRSE